MYTILIVEDCNVTGSFLRDYIDSELPRLVEIPDPGMDPKNPTNQHPYPNAEEEPGQGQLGHLQPVFKHLKFEVKNRPETPKELYRKPILLPEYKLRELIILAENYTPRFVHNRSSSDAEKLREVIYSVCKPDVLIVDLVLNDEQGEMMEAAGGFQTLTQGSPDNLADPRSALRTLTGFKLLTAFSGEIPVIATSYLPNPLISQHCIVNGAFAYLKKPVPSRDQTGNHIDFASVDKNIPKLDLSAKRNESSLDVAVTAYLTQAVAETVKAMGLRYLSEADPL